MRQHPGLAVEHERVVQFTLVEVGDVTEEITDCAVDAHDTFQLTFVIHRQTTGYENACNKYVTRDDLYMWF